MKSNRQIARRTFLKNCAVLGSGLGGMAWTLRTTNAAAAAPAEQGMNIIGPRDGFSPQIGTLVSMLNWMRGAILGPVQGLTVKQLDYLHDPKANTIGALLLHLAATERHYQVHTFEDRKWGDFDAATRKRWGAAGRLGDAGRKSIKGNALSYYFDALQEIRAHTLAELAKRDDAWLMKVDADWPWGPTNNYCKWFHVCEHESNHNGQVKWIIGRLPGAKRTDD